ncbi:MAG: ATPase domain-containing protein [archaeon]
MAKKTSIERIKTGIIGLDWMLEGGLPSGSVIGLSGPAGIGKSLLSLHFLLEGAKNYEKGIYINLEEPRKNIDRIFSSANFGSNLLEHEKNGKLKIMCIPYDEFENIYNDLFTKIREDKKITRLVIDSYNGFFNFHYGTGKGESIASKVNLRRLIVESFSLFRREGLTTLLVLEKDPKLLNDFTGLVSFFIDGEISLEYLSFGNIERRIFIPKMRWTCQHDSALPFVISNSGIKVNK